MTSTNLLAWSLQTGVLVAIAGLVAAAFRLRAPKRSCSTGSSRSPPVWLLPFIRAWKQESIVLTNTFVEPDSVVASAINAVAMAPSSVSWETVLVCLLALVSIARLGWLMAGLARMRSYRRRATPFPPQRQWGMEAELAAISRRHQSRHVRLHESGDPAPRGFRADG